jgi:DNA-binding CsgD family transcriptional regulator
MRDGLLSTRDVQGPVGMAMPLALAARLASTLDQPTRAVRLAGAIAVIGEDRQSPLIPIFEVLLQEALDEARKMLDGESFASEWEAGRAMSVEEGIGEALAIELEPRSLLGRPVRSGASPVFASLTPAEQRVLRLLTEGLTTKAIATELFVSVSTIDRHLTHIYSKLGVRNRAEAIALVLTQQTG